MMLGGANTKHGLCAAARWARVSCSHLPWWFVGSSCAHIVVSRRMLTPCLVVVCCELWSLRVVLGGVL